MSAQAASSLPFQDIWESQSAEIERRIVTLEEAVSALLMGALDEPLCRRAEVDAHMLAGSLGMFGVAEGTALAREVEGALSQAGGPVLAQAPQLAEQVLALRAARDRRSAAGNAPTLVPVPTTGPLLLLVGSDAALSERLTVEALGRGLQPRTAVTFADARRFAESESPAAVIIDVEGEGVDLDVLDHLAQRHPSVPVVVLSGSAALDERVEIARRGGRGFLPRVAPAGQVLDLVESVVERSDQRQLRVLTLDDDHTVSAALTSVLGAHGLAVTALSDATHFWDTLEELKPDLLILDLDMPGFSGTDLCRTVRADRRFATLPVIFLTAATDAQTVREIFAAGADDYVSKPVAGPDILARVTNRLERASLRDAGDAGDAGEAAAIGADEGPDVVVVEDDDVMAGLLIESLEARGHRPRRVADGGDALTLLGGSDPQVRPGVVVLDVDLPGMDGLSILRRLAADGVLDQTRVIMLTARAGETEVLEALELGAFDHMAKPFSLPVLVQKVRRALER